MKNIIQFFACCALIIPITMFAAEPTLSLSQQMAALEKKAHDLFTQSEAIGITMQARKELLQQATEAAAAARALFAKLPKKSKDRSALEKSIGKINDDVTSIKRSLSVASTPEHLNHLAESLGELKARVPAPVKKAAKK